jgi:uncharacterized protein with PIN domain
MKLYCDEMLIRLGHWLRAAGYDTEIAGSDMTDRELLESALNQQRKLITRDRKLNEFRLAEEVVVLLRANLFEDCVEEITDKLGIDWLRQPFCRCMICNASLQKATAAQVEELNHSLIKTVNNVYYCPRCEQFFWVGSHVTRMRARLAEFNRLYGCKTDNQLHLVQGFMNVFE